ncbi:cytochrome P450 [Acaryochloris sp. CCMEE 5410]|uniref:cytochrome P450 n=1 Tax=Acaryochloris sp. CCMEE 5410 TaxID=310037 RepID=UPI000248483E|nr:cytochrome P450 [Acaryochloris sp. CCMEE 5410]
MHSLLKRANKIPGDFGLPFIGEAAQLFGLQQLYYHNQYQKYGNIFKTKIMDMKFVVIADPKVNQIVLKDQSYKVSSKLGWKFLEPILGNGILLQDGYQHQSTRRLIYPALHGEALSNYVYTIQQATAQYLEEWVNDTPNILLERLRKLVLNISCKLFLGSNDVQEINELSQWFSDYTNGLRTVIRLNTPITRFGRACLARKRLEDYIYSQIEARRTSKNLKESKDVLGLLMASIDEEGNYLADVEIATQTIQLLFGGHETTARLLCWVLIELANHPDWKNKLRREQLENTSGNDLTISELNQLLKMKCVIKEVERLYPPTYFIPRGVIEDIEINGYIVPAGWFVMLSPLLTHRLHEIYHQPNTFNPARFLPPLEEDKKHPFALIGFGGGPHRCLGYGLAQVEMKIILSTILRNFEWSFSPATSINEPVLQPSKLDTILKIHLKRIS